VASIGTENKTWQRELLLVLFIGGVLYGTSFQQYRHFDIESPRGSTDARSYLRMSHGDFNVRAMHRYRFIIPVLVSAIRPAVVLLVGNSSKIDFLAFYLVNFVLMSATAYVFFYLLRSFGFGDTLSYVGICIFLSSRITVQTTGTPLVDSLYYFAIAVVFLGVKNGKITQLILAYPLLILSKATIIPFLMLPLLTHWQHRWKIFVSLALSVTVVALARHYLFQLASPDDQRTFVEAVSKPVTRFASNVARLFTPSGLHSLQCGYSFFLCFGVVGFVLNSRRRLHDIPNAFLLIVPLSLTFSLMSGNIGRMFFTSSFVVIPYALICIEHVLRPDPCDRTQQSLCE